MSKMNAVRIINLNYNNNTMKIDDETFYLNGESTLMALRNGGGKSVIVQMLMAPFMSKGKRSLKDREFESYFTTNKPTFILVEWVKDYGAGYVLTGMMVRKRQDNLEEMEKEPLEVIQFIHEYKEDNAYDIGHLPVVEVTERGKKLKSFSEVKQLFEKLKKDANIEFSYYDMSQSHQARRYFNHLKENQIHQKEWESIIKPINLKESGLSELFNDAKNAKGLVEKWFLRAVNDKLNKEEDKIKRFRENLMKYIHQYKDNASKINRKLLIEKFNEEVQLIFTEAYDFKNILSKGKSLENSIVSLREGLIECVEKLKQEVAGQEDLENILNRGIQNLKYEALCIAIYEELEKEQALLMELESNQEASHEKERQKQEILDKIHQGECAKIYGEYQKASKDVQKYENDLENLKRENEDLTPLRNNLGYTLSKHFMEQEIKIDARLEKIQEQLELNQKEKGSLVNKEQEIRRRSNTLQQNKGSYEAQIKSYDKEEIQYNKTYANDLRRNILGYYETNCLYEQKTNLKGLEEEISYTITKLRNKQQVSKEQLQTLQGQEKDLDKIIHTNSYKLEQQQEILQKLENLLIQRKAIIKYVGLDESKVFDEEKILRTFEEYIERLIDKERSETLVYDKKIEEYESLKSGKVLKLPEALEEAIETLGITIMYGMEWLKKNGYEETVNTKLVEANPFIPYALIMSHKDLMRLKESKLNLYTETPIPIIKREDLENYTLVEDRFQIYEFNKVSFLVAFNEKLLNEKMLQKLIEDTELELEEIKKNLDKKREEVHLYEQKKNQVLYGELNAIYYKQTKEKIDVLREQLNKVKKEKDEVVLTIKKLEQEGQQFITEIEKAQNTLDKFKNQYDSLKTLEVSYEEYCDKRKLLDETQKALSALEEEIKNQLIKREQLYKVGDELEGEKRNVEIERSTIKEQVLSYASYKEGEYIEKDIEDLEAQYKSITEKISLGQKALEEQLQIARTRFKDYQDEIIEKAREYELEEKSYIHLTYSRFEEKQLKSQIKEIEQTLKNLQGTFGNLKEQKGQLTQSILVLKNNLQEKFAKPLKEKTLLIVVDFAKLTHQKQEELNKVEAKKLMLEKEKNVLMMHLIGLDEFANLKADEKVILSFTTENVDRIKSELIRDYRSNREERTKRHNTLYKVISEMQHKEAFQDEFFSTPLSTLQKIVDNPDFIIENLTNTLGAYETLMIKLEADIALIEKEKQSVIDGFMQYIYEVHEHIGKIDKNSTVTILEKPIKMLKIELPDWEEHEKIYELRLKDFIEDITKKGLNQLEQNETIEELIGKSITTKNLYDVIVGIGQVGIKLYKIEEEKVYQISWDEVAKNSGGEGFLSAFVVLSSLLSYMRRDDNDLWGDKESGKVLVMDNPFAQTNAAHLLKPLMDMANKRNTQLICLSGLNGESIYNRFDNIYALNLVHSRLHEGTKYLKSEHIRGEETVEELVGVQIQTEDMNQMTLF